MPRPSFSLSSLGFLALASSVALSAQTATTPVHHTGTAATHRPVAHTPARPTCAVLPTISTKVPALPAGTPCAKPLYTITTKLDAMSPMVGPEVRSNFSDLPMTFTLAYIDIKVGTGELAKPHMYYTVQYTGYLASDGTKFDSSLDHPETSAGFPFPYGGHRVIPGWDTGFEGMHVGGKRRLFVPYQLAYGERGHPPTIPARAELVFDMELLSQSAQPPAPPTPPVAPSAPIRQPGTVPATPPTGTQSLPTTPTTPPTPGTTPPPATPATPTSPTSTPPPTTPGTTPHP